MTKVIQLVKVNEDDYLFIIDFKEDTEELVFRISSIPEYLQTEKVVIDKGKVYTNLHWFDANFLVKFLKANDRLE